eukprot:scaffold8767_cov121-Isochrysis_galbana.AAC.8
MGDPSRYPEIRMVRFLYAMQWLPPDLRADYHLRQQWIDNNRSYLDARALAVLQDGDHTFRRDSWIEYRVPQPPYVPPWRVPPIASGP